MPIGGAARDEPRVELCEPIGQIASGLFERRRAFERELADDVHVRAVAPHAPEREALEEDRADAEEIASAIERVAHRLLGRHVRGLAFHLAGLGDVLRLDLRDAEVEQPHVPVVAEHHVLRRHVAMNELQRLPVVVGKLVRGVQPATDLGEHVRDERGPRHSSRRLSVRAHGARARAAGPRRTPSREELAVDLAVVVRAHDVRVIEHRREPRLAQEHLDASLVARGVGQEPLQRDDALVAALVVGRARRLARRAPPRRCPCRRDR